MTEPPDGIDLEPFALATDSRFEASGVARIEGTDRLLVVNDKGKRRVEDRLAIVAWRGGQLVVQGTFAATRTDGMTIGARGFEDAAGSRLSKGVVWAVTSYGGSDDPAKRHVLRLSFDDDGVPTIAESVDLVDPEAFTGLGYVNVEALALDPSETTLYLGARCWGATKPERVFGAAVYAYSLANLSADPTLLFQVELTGLLGRVEGLAALEHVPELGGYLLITSYEDKQTDALGGHLWFAESLSTLAEPNAWSALPRLSLPSKPEGVCVDSEGKILVVFDPDKDRKRAAGLAPNQAFYARIDPSRLLPR